MTTTVSKRPLAAPPGVAVRAIIALRKGLLRAADAVTPAPMVMLERASAAGISILLGEIARLGVAAIVNDAPKTAEEIAKATSTDADAMKRTMRAAVAVGIFTRGKDGRFANNRLSRALLPGDDSVARWFCEYFASKSNIDSWCAFPETLRTGKNGFERVHGKTVWEWFDEHPSERETFARAMTTMTLLDAPGIAGAYPFGEIGKLCDVGGGRGTLLSEILLHHPKLRGVLCDAAGVLDSAKPFLEMRGVADRVELTPGSFFDRVPEGADAYIMKNILHDWDDARSIAILKVVRASMKPGQRLLVVEAIVEDDTEDFGALVDIQMMVVCCEGRERGRADFARLFEASGFRMARVIEAPTPIAIVEGIAVQ